MNNWTFRIAVAIALWMGFGHSSADASPGCERSGLPQRVIGLCRTPLFKAYVHCIEKTMPAWDPKGPKLSKLSDLQIANLALTVLMECETTAREFGSKYGYDLANILQSVANKRVSEQFGIPPLVDPTGNSSTFLEYGEHIDRAHVQRGDVHDDRTDEFRRAVSSPAADSPEVTYLSDLLTGGASCTLQIDGKSSSCDLVWYMELKDGGRAVQFNKGTENNSVVSFVGVQKDLATISVDHINLRIGDRSATMNVEDASGQCVLGKTAMACQARLGDGRLLMGSIPVLPSAVTDVKH